MQAPVPGIRFSKGCHTLKTRVFQLPSHKLILLASVLLIMAGPLGAQDPNSPGLPVAHPWDPNSPLPGPSILGPSILSPIVPSLPLSNTNWTALGPAPIASGQRPGGGPVSGRIAGIAADPSNANILYVASAGGGVWKTTDGGSTWNPLTDSQTTLSMDPLTDSQTTLSMGAIAIAPSNSQVIYAGTGEANNSGDSNFGRGVMVSTNGGSTWTLQKAGGAFDRKAISEIAVDPTNANTVYVAISGGGVNGLGGNDGVWKSTNGGDTWTNTTASITTTNPWSSVRIDVNNPATLYAAVGNIFGTATNGVYKTTNGGTTWTLLANAPNGSVAGRIVVAVSKSNSQVVYVSATSPTGTFGSLYKIERSDDGGSTFTDLTAGTPNYMGGQGWYDTTLIVDPSNSAIVYVAGAAGTNSILRSTNSGANWTDINSVAGVGPHVDHHAAAFDANGTYLDGDDGGIYRYDPTIHSWTQLNGSAGYLNTIQFQGIGLHPSDINTTLGGSQDNGTEKYAGTLSWTLVEGGDGGFVKFSKTNSLRVYHQAPVASFGSANFFRRSDNGGTIWAGKVSGITDNTAATQNFYSPFAVDPGNGDRVLYGARHLFETTNGGDSWSALGSAFANNIDAIGLSPSDSNTIYVSAAGNTFVTTNHGTTWTQYNLPVGGFVADIQVDHANSQIAYAVIRQFTSGGNVFKTTNGGISWTNITGNLPNLPVWSFQADPNTANLYYVGTDNGVYNTAAGGTTWNRFGSGLPDAQVFQIELNSSLGVLGAATHGRGAWEILTSIPDISVTSGSSTVNGTTVTIPLKLSNTGGTTANNVIISGVTPVSPATYIGPAIPVTVGNIAPGTTVSQNLQIDVTGFKSGSVAHVQINGSYQDGAGNNYQYSVVRGVKLP